MKMFLAALAASFVMCNSSTGPDDPPASDGPLHPPVWIVGTWEGGSPYKVHLEFTSGNCYDSKGNEQFVGYSDASTDATTYGLSKESNISIFTQISANQMQWYVDNGVINNTTLMNKIK
jgi:hypothetical protein